MTLASFWYQKALVLRYPQLAGKLVHIRVCSWLEHSGREVALRDDSPGMPVCTLPDIRRAYVYKRFFSIDITCVTCRNWWKGVAK